jgi:V/A-type H+-transporting ATPase subunit A
MKLLVQFYKGGQQALKDGATLVDIRVLSVIGTLLKARMEIKDDEMDKLDQLSQTITEQFKSISGVKVST